MKEYNNNTEFVYTPHPASTNVNILHNHVYIYKTKKLTLAQYC